jgi:transcriptional regulator GlxA family with amidase domain
MESDPPTLVGRTNRRLAPVFEHVERNLTRQPSLKELARIARLERTYFCRYFKKNVGMSFSEWNRRLRVEHAKTLLRTSSISITAIALSVGYADVTNLERNFRKREGVSPRQFRNNSTTTTTLAERSTTPAENVRILASTLQTST